MRLALSICITFFLLACNNSSDNHEEKYFLNYENGEKYCEGIYLVYSDGGKTKIGQWRYYFPNGDLKSLVEYNEDYFLGYKYYDEGGILIESFSQKEGVELYSDFYENGNLKKEIVVIINDDGVENKTEKEYYSNGELMVLKEYEDDIQINKEKIWNKFGKLVLELQYESGEIIKK